MPVEELHILILAVFLKTLTKDGTDKAIRPLHFIIRFDMYGDEFSDPLALIMSKATARRT